MWPDLPDDSCCGVHPEEAVFRRDSASENRGFTVVRGALYAAGGCLEAGGAF